MRRFKPTFQRQRRDHTDQIRENVEPSAEGCESRSE
jgi:hypothetical protein